MGIVFAKNEKNDFLSEKYIQINSCGKYLNRDYTIIRKNGRSDYHILLVYSGECEAVYDSKRYTLTEGDFILYEPKHTQEYTFSEEGCVTCWMHFSGTAIPEILKDCDIRPGVHKCTPSAKVVSVFNEIIREFQLKQYMHQTAENSQLIYLFACISRHISDYKGTSDIEKVIMLMHDTYTSEYNHEKYAAACSLSQSRFAHKFKEVTGLSPTKYFINIRIEKAKELLSFSDLSVTEIAGNVGYDNALYFSRLFNKATGFSPSEYRKKHAKKN